MKPDELVRRARARRDTTVSAVERDPVEHLDDLVGDLDDDDVDVLVHLQALREEKVMSNTAFLGAVGRLLSCELAEAIEAVER